MICMYDMNDLREVGPSRKMLHVRDGRSKSRKSVTRVGGTWGALGATLRIITVSANSLIWPLQGSPILAARMRIAQYYFQFYGFRKNIFYAVKHGNSYYIPSPLGRPKALQNCTRSTEYNHYFIYWKYALLEIVIIFQRKMGASSDSQLRKIDGI